MSAPQALKRGGWALAAQAVASVTNVLLIVVVARAVQPAAFGEFAILYGYYVVTVELSRAAVSEPLLVRIPRGVEPVASGCGGALLFGVAAAVPLMGLSVLMFGTITVPALVLAGLLPVLTVQDAYRMAFVATGRPARALANAAVWAVAQIAATVLVLLFTADLGWVILAWGSGAGTAAAFAMTQTRILPRPAAVPGWLRDHGDLAKPFLIEAAALSVSGYAVLVLAGWIAGLPAAGALRAAQTLAGPAGVVLNAGRVAAISELSRERRLLSRGVVLTSAALGAAGAVGGGVLLLIPDSVGRALLGETWPLVVPLLLMVALTQVAIGLGTGPHAALRATEKVRELFALRLAGAVAKVGAGAGGAAIAGAAGTVAGLAAVEASTAVTAAILHKKGVLQCR